jgi:hypothetical protein
MLAIIQIRALAKDNHYRLGARLSLARNIRKTQSNSPASVSRQIFTTQNYW